MEFRPRFLLEGIPLVVAGFAWLAVAFASGLIGFVCAAIPGSLLVASGGALTLFAGDRRILHFGAVGGVFGAVFALFGLPFLGFGVAGVLLLLSLGAALASGYASLRLEVPAVGVPEAVPSKLLAAKVAVDEAFMAHLQLSLRLPTLQCLTRMRREVHEALDLHADRGWSADPLSFHREPPTLENPVIQTRRTRGRDFEHLVFDSGFEPRPEEPGRERWLGFEPLRKGHAYVMRHEGEPRPWLVCINGYRMGFPFVDFQAFDPKRYHEELGLNLLIPVLPLHGPRRIGAQSGDALFDGELVDTVHVEAQAVWDIRRLVGWIRHEGATGVGVTGLSLGGYNAALLASVEPDLDCAIAGIPLADLSSIFWHHGSDGLRQDLERAELNQQDLARLFGVVSPLALKPRLASEACSIFGGIADRIVPPAQIAALIDHWQPGRVAWYAGTHLSFGMEPMVKSVVRETIQEFLPQP
ncbi:MAG: alpha/beta hydrolase family protein [Myxococcota bacterium]